MVGQLALDQRIGVRLPASQPISPLPPLLEMSTTDRFIRAASALDAVDELPAVPFAVEITERWF
jgi:hypothetical protein